MYFQSLSENSDSVTMQEVGWKLQKPDEELISVHNSVTTMEALSDCLIGKILCFLPFKEAARTSILTKTWWRAWLTHPNLEFVVNPGNIKIVDTIVERYRDRKIPIEKFNLSVSAGTVSLPILTILEVKSLRELVLKGCTLMPVSLSSGLVAPICYSLRKLSLSLVHLDENMFQTLLNSCPLIASFIFEYCSGLEKIELLNLQKIKSVSISKRTECPLKIRAPTLEHLSYSCYFLDELDVIECPNLKSLDLLYVSTSDGFLQRLISRFQSLEVLKIQCYEGITEVDSPNLVSFEYTGDQIPQLIILRESRKLKHSKIGLHCFDSLNDAWFCELRKFLSNSTSWSQVSLYFPNCDMINMKDLQWHHRVANPQADVFVPTPQVDVLNVDILRQNEECPMFVDALLRSCHPRRLNLHSSIKMITCFMHRVLMYTMNSSLASSQLIEIEAFDEKNEPLELRSAGELAISTLMERKKVYFLLDWRCS